MTELCFATGPARPSTSRSPWAMAEGIEYAEVFPLQQAFNTSLSIPGSKSVTNRALLLAGFAEGNSRVHDVLKSDDSWWCLDALVRLGARVQLSDSALNIEPAEQHADARPLYLGSAGTLARFLPGLLLSRSGTFEVLASDQLQGRPVADLFQALASLGAHIHSSEGRYPATLEGGSLSGGSVTMSGKVSSQFISGVLMAGPLMPHGLRLRISDHIVQSDYVRITLDVMRSFGVEVDVNKEFTEFNVAPSIYKGGNYRVEADASTASYFFALAAAGGGDITVQNIQSRTLQPDIGLLRVLEQMGATVEEGEGIRVRAAKTLKGGFEVDMRPMSDATLTLAAIAPFADAPISLKNVAHIRHHESDRISAMVTELSKCGIKVDEFEDGMTIYPGKPQHSIVESYDDHRVAMSMSVLAALGSGGRILDPGCVSKTCPQFFELIGQLGVKSKLR